MIALLAVAPLLASPPPSPAYPRPSPAPVPVPVTPAVHGAIFPPPPTVPPPKKGGGYKGPEASRGGAPRTKGPRSPGVGGPAPPGAPGAAPPKTPPVTGGQPATPGLDPGHWSQWWTYNGAGWIQLKTHVHRGGPRTGSDSWYLGHGRRAEPTPAVQGGSVSSLAPDPALVDGSVVPALRASLARETSDDGLTAALVALARIGRRGDESAAAFVGRFTPFLAHPSQEVAETAAVALGLCADPAAVPTLGDLALDTPRGQALVHAGQVPYRTRAFATYGLGLAALASADPDLRQGIAETLVDLLEEGPQATPDLRVAAVTGLGLVPMGLEPRLPRHDSGRRPGENVVHVLSLRTQVDYLSGLHHPRRPASVHRQVRAHAATALGRLLTRAPGSLRRIVAGRMIAGLRTRSGDPEEVRASATLALGSMGDASDDGPKDVDTAIRATLVRLVAEGQPQVRRFALISLARVGARAGEGEGPQSTAGRAQCRRTLLATLARGRNQLQPWSALALGVMGRELADRGETLDESVTRALRAAAAGCRRPEDIGAYALALGLRRDPGSEDLLLGKVEEFADPTARGHLLLALGLLGERSSIEALEEVLASSLYLPDLLARAATGLALLGHKPAVQRLVTMLGEARGLASQAALASALGRAGDRRTVAPLLELYQAEDVTDRARAFAAVALGLVCDPRPLPWNFPLSRGTNYAAATATLVGQGRGVLEIL